MVNDNSLPFPDSFFLVGAGHNGPVSAYYLARAGISVVVLERRDFVGGACVTEELFDGLAGRHYRLAVVHTGRP